jgi:holin-like protein
MVRGIGILLGSLLLGEAAVRALGVPIPGAIVGLILLFAWLQARTFTDLQTPEAIDKTPVAQVATPLLQNLGILFVPAGVGIVQYSDLFARLGPKVLFVLIASTLITMGVTAIVFAAAQLIPTWLHAASGNNDQVRDRSSHSVAGSGLGTPVHLSGQDR